MEGIASVKELLEELKAGRPVILVDDEDRENEGDLIMAAEHVTPEWVNFMLKECRGLLCVALTEERAKALDLPLMVERNQDPQGTRFTVSVDARGTTTGISAFERAATIRLLADPEATAQDFRRPGHVFPLVARPGGVLRRAGHTEATVDLLRLAGLTPVGSLIEILKEDGTMARLPDLLAFARRHGLKVGTIADLIRYRLEKGDLYVRREAEALLPTRFGEFRILGYRDTLTGEEHAALVMGSWAPEEPVLVRMHSECLTGDALHSLRCDCGFQRDLALQRIAEEGKGVLVYLRQEGRGIGLVNKIKAYHLQDQGLDTVEANLALGFPPDLRDYGVGAQILSDLGVQRLRLITNNPRKIAGLGGYGLQVEDRVPLVMDAGSHNAAYLQTKRIKLGHLMGEGPSCPIGGPTAVLAWHGTPAGDELDTLGSWAISQGLQVEREDHPRLLALLNQPQLAVVLGGLDQASGGVGALGAALALMAGWPQTSRLSLLLAPDTQRSSHPSANLEPDQRPLTELGAVQEAGLTSLLTLQPGAFLVWR